MDPLYLLIATSTKRLLWKGSGTGTYATLELPNEGHPRDEAHLSLSINTCVATAIQDPPTPMWDITGGQEVDCLTL